MELKDLLMGAISEAVWMLNSIADDADQGAMDQREMANWLRLIEDANKRIGKLFDTTNGKVGT